MLPELSKDFVLMRADPKPVDNQILFCVGQINRITSLMKNGGHIESSKVAIAFFNNIVQSLDELQKLKSTT